MRRLLTVPRRPPGERNPRWVRILDGAIVIVLGGTAGWLLGGLTLGLGWQL